MPRISLRYLSVLLLLPLPLVAQDREVIEDNDFSNTLNFSDSPVPVEVYGNGGNDDITGSAFSDLINGGTGNDIVRGGDGDDFFVVDGDSGEDIVNGGAGFDELLGADGMDNIIRFRRYNNSDRVERITGGDGANLIEGSRFANTLDFRGTELVDIDGINGLAGNDTIFGSDGPDLINGGPGNDVLRGEGDDDIFLFEGNDGGFDRLRGDAGIDLALGSQGNDVLGLIRFNNADVVEVIDGNGGIDIIAGDSRANAFDFSGTQLIGNWSIVGASGNDSITGTAGNDVIQGGPGSDTLVGGTGYDIAVFDGPQADYLIDILDEQTVLVTFTPVGGSPEIDRLTSFNELVFDDGSFILPGSNQPPLANPDSFDGVEDTALAIAGADLLSNDADPEGMMLTLVSVQNAIGGSVELAGDTVTFTPNDDFFGPATFQYTVSDPAGATANGDVAVDVAGVNDAPTGVDDQFSQNQDVALVIAAATLVANDIDVDGDALTVTGVRDAVNGGVDFDGTDVTFTPNGGFIGLASFVYDLEDAGGDPSSALVEITFTEVNNPPVAANDNVDGTEDQVAIIAIADLLSNDDDPDGDAIDLLNAFGAQNGSLVVNGDSIEFTPATDFFGQASFQYEITDGELPSAPAQVTIAVAAVNDAPIAIGESFTIDANEILTLPIAELLLNDSDVEGDLLAIDELSGELNGTAVFDGQGNVVFTPSQDYRGPAGFTYRVADGNGGLATATVDIQIGLEVYVYAASRNQDRVLYWNATTGEYLGRLIDKDRPQRRNIGSLTIGPDNNLYVSWSGDNAVPAKVTQHDLLTGNLLGDFSDFSQESDTSREQLDTMDFAPDGSLLVFDNGAGKPLHKMFRFQGPFQNTPGAFVDEFITVEEFCIPARRLIAFDMEFREEDGLLYMPSQQYHEILQFNPPGAPNEGELFDVFTSMFVLSNPKDGFIIECVDNGFDCILGTQPQGIAWGPDGNLYVAASEILGDFERILIFDPQGQYIEDLVGVDQAWVGHLRDIDFGPDGNLYVANRDAGEIRVYSGPASQTPGTLLRTLTAPGETFTGSISIEVIPAPQ